MYVCMHVWLIILKSTFSVFRSVRVAGKYPYKKCNGHIEMVQTILESDAPKPPAGHFSPEFEEFIGVCLNKDPKQRLPAEVLLQSPWLQRNGATSYGQSVANVASWIASMQ